MKKFKNKNFKLSPLLVVLIISILFSVLLLIRWPTKNEPKLSQLNQQNYVPKSKDELDHYDISKYPACKHYGDELKEEYFPTYIVKKGDSLLSIAKRQLGSSEKYKLIVWYNRDQYPHLSTDLQNTLIEPGWKLVLPPSYAPDDVMLQVRSGHVMKHIDGTNWGIVGKDWYYLGFDFDFFKYDSGEVPQIGNCATIVSDGFLNIYKFEKQIN